YLIGTTGTGKTTLLQNMAYQDMTDPTRPGLCVLDPHGDFIDDLLDRVPEDRLDDVILFDPGSREQYERPLGLNLLSCDRGDPRQVARVTDTVINTLRKLYSYSWGPRMEDLLRHAILTLMATPETTFLELLLMLVSPLHRAKFTGILKDPVLRHFWEIQFTAYDKRQRTEVVGSSLNKIGRFLANPLMRHVIAQPENAFSMREIMDGGKILLVNLSKGDLGEDNSSLLGSLLVNLILTTALERREMPPNQRRKFHLLVDEYQNFATESFATLQSEARKYGITVTVAHQYRDQLDRQNLGATLNVGNFIVMRATGIDAYDLASQFDNQPPPPEIHYEPIYKPFRKSGETGEQLFIPTSLVSRGEKKPHRQVERHVRSYMDVQAQTANELSTMANFRARCRLIDNSGLVECEVKTMRPMGQADESHRQYIVKQSAQLGARRKDVEADIERRMGTVRFDQPPPFGEETGGEGNSN
ncbi:MAG: type IV secretory system conjugative DNA transfer family protein, partial [Proteobacteria bacterium]|nr:type IV secretory system conjugative DNA transfer family protein [Pseudomonadota bacterium]